MTHLPDPQAAGPEVAGPEAIWQELVTAALLGTERRPFELPANLPGGLAALADPGPTPEACLHLAALLGLYRRAGRLPFQAGPVEYPACPPDPRPFCSPAAVQRLTTILDGQHLDLLPEYLRVLAGCGRRLPDELLPRLLDQAVTGSALLEPVLAVAGPRAQWLAAFNPAWEGVLAAALADAASQAGLSGTSLPAEFLASWQTGNRSTRRLLFGRLRRGCPSAARSLLESEWADTAAAERAMFLAGLEEKLGPEDERFLESALDDRSKEVRSAAAALLAHLPASQRQNRLWQVAQGWLVNTAGRWPLRKARLEVNLSGPESLSAGLKRDLVEIKPPFARSLGEKAWQLYSLVAGIDPGQWCRAWNVTPAVLLELATQTEWKEVLVGAWALAAQRRGHSEWAEALLLSGLVQTELLAVLPPERCDALLLSRLQADPGAGMNLVYSLRRPWSPELSRGVLRQLRTYFSTQKYWQVRSMFKEIALWMDPGLAPEAWKLLSAPIEAPDPEWERSLQVPLAILQFRHAMHQELAAT